MERDTGSPVVFHMDEGGGKRKRDVKRQEEGVEKPVIKKKNQRKTKKLSNMQRR